MPSHDTGVAAQRQIFKCLEFTLQIGITGAAALLGLHACDAVALWLRILIAVIYVLLQWTALYMLVGLHWHIRNVRAAQRSADSKHTT